jgi:hypothetical protein
METSMLKTLAGKHRSTVTKMASKYKTVVGTPDGPRTCFQVVIARDRGRKPLRHFLVMVQVMGEWWSDVDRERGSR